MYEKPPKAFQLLGVVNRLGTYSKPKESDYMSLPYTFSA